MQAECISIQSDEILFECKIPGRTRILKNSKRMLKSRKTGKMFPAKNERYLGWEAFAKLFIYRHQPAKTIDFPVNAKMVFYFKDHAHEPDLSNLYQGVEDVLQKCGVIKDDKLIYSHDGSRKVFGDGPERVEIFITRLK